MSTKKAEATGAAAQPLRVGMTAWAAVELEQVKSQTGDMRFGNRKHDIGVVVKVLDDMRTVVVFKNAYSAVSGLKVEWAKYTDRRFCVQPSLLLSANPTRACKDHSELYKAVDALKRREPNLTAKQAHGLVCTSFSEAPTLSAVKHCLQLLRQRNHCPLVHALSLDLLELIAELLPLTALLQLSATCGELRDALMDTRLMRSEANVKAHDMSALMGRPPVVQAKIPDDESDVSNDEGSSNYDSSSDDEGD